MREKHIPALDGIRGLAVLAVMLFHLVYPWHTGLFGKVCTVGWVGVDIFFVLSGFLITGILFDTQYNESFYKNFYIRRVLRLSPAYFVLIAVTLLLAHGFGSRPLRMTLPFLLYGSNIVRLFDVNFKSIGPTQLAHIWSLAVEEQFYLIWPWVIGFLAARGRIFKACLIGCVAALGLRLILSPLPLPYATLYTQLPTRADSLLLGGAVAMLVRDPQLMARLRSWHFYLVGILAAIGFIATGAVAHSFSFAAAPVDTWGFSFTAIGSAALIMLAITQGTWANHIFSVPFLRFYGKYSYGIYLVHFAPITLHTRLIWFLTARIHIIGLATVLAACITIAFSTGIAVISFHLIEKPFLKLKKYFEGRPATQHAPSPSQIPALEMSEG